MPSSDYKGFDEAALEILFKEHFKPLCAYCQSRFGFELQVAKEIVHTGFIRLWENRDTISSDLSVKGYLYKIVGNASLDMLKHERVKIAYAKHLSLASSDHTSENDFSESGYKQLVADIDKAVHDLPEQMRKVFELSRYDELKYTEIAARLNISIKTVETQMSRALAKLREKLAQYLTALIIALLSNL